MSVRGFTIDQVGMVTNALERRRVVNKTGLSGPLIDPDGPSIFTAFEEQLGLKLESQKGDTAVLVIDHVEHPTVD
jgi:hypothetical protein